MISYRVSKWEGSPGSDRHYVEGACLSTDTKPTTQIANGSCLIEMDTATIYFYNADGGEWLPFEG